MKKYNNCHNYYNVYFILLFLNCFGFHKSTNAQTILIWPTEIEFNFESGNANDAVLLIKNATTDIALPEYKQDLNRNENFAYIKGQTGIKIKVKFSSNSSNMNFLVKATVISGTGIGNVYENFVGACDINTNWITFDVSGSIPNSVGKRDFKWKWDATALPLNSPYCPITCTSVNTAHTYYTLLSTPNAPMGIPWTEVLEYSCIWASGQTTEYSVVSSITEGAYYNLGKYYNGSDTHAVLPYFDLTGLFSEGWTDCRDMSAVVQVFSNAVGCSNIMVRSIDYYFDDFWYKPILPIGWTKWSDNDDKPDYWNFHQFGYLDNVFDATLKLKKSSPRIPLNEDIDGSYKTDLFQSGSWNKDNPDIYTNVY